MPVFLFFIIVTSISNTLMILFPSIGLLLGIMWGGLLIMAGLYLAPSGVLIISLVNSAILFVFGGTEQFVYYLTFFGLAAFVMAVQAAQYKDYHEIQKWGILAGFFSVTIFLGVIYLQTGGLGIEELQKQLLAHAQQSMQYYNNSYYEQIGISQTEIEAAMNSMVLSIARHLPAFYYIQTIITVFFMLLFASYLSLKQDIGRLKKKAFSQQCMPWPFSWVVIIGLGFWIWGRDEMNQLYYLGSNILAVMVVIALYYGLSTLVYKIGHQKPSAKTWWITGMVLMTLIFPLSAILFVSLIGIFDSLVDFRRLRIRQEE